MHPITRSYLYLHIAILLWGFTAVLGDLISISALSLVWWRVLFSAGMLLLWPGILGRLRLLPKLAWRRYGWIGLVVGLHWLAFYGSIKLANASIALIAMSTGAFFAALIEPIIFKREIKRADIILGILVIPAMFLVASDFDQTKLVGLIVGIIAAALAAYFTVLNKLWIQEEPPEVITFVEMFASWLLMSVIIMGQSLLGNEVQLTPTKMDVFYLVVLAGGCTILPFVLHLKSLNHISAFVSNLMNNLEPVYGIILAALILKDYQELTTTFYIGVLLLLTVVFAYPVLNRKST